MRLLIFTDMNGVVADRLVRATLWAASERDDIEVRGFVTSRPDDYRSPGQTGPVDLFDLARHLDVPVLVPPGGDPNDEGFRRRLADEVGADVALSLYCLQIFRRPLLDTFSQAINFHNGFLPQYRGRMATSFALYNGEPRVGYTFHRMTESVDGGPILVDGSVAVGPDDDLPGVTKRLASEAARQMPRVLELAAAGDPGRPQHGAGSYFSALDVKAKTLIERPEQLSVGELRRRLRAFGVLEVVLDGDRHALAGLGSPDEIRGPAFRTADGVRVGLIPPPDTMRPERAGEPMAGAAFAPSAADAVVVIELGDGPHEVRFRSTGADLVTDQSDALVPLVLLPAMRAGRDVRIEGPVSARLTRALPVIQDLVSGWFPDEYVPIDVDITTAIDGAPGGELTACFFTAGLDSFCEVLRRRDEIDELVYVHGFDLPLADEARQRDAGHAVRSAAAELGLPLVEVDTDLRSFADPLVDWEHFHGAALAAVALLLRRRYRRVLMASTESHDPVGWGTHPTLDPLWSTEELQFEHGSRMPRIEKAAVAAASETAMRRLRVCFRPPRGELNCGRCEKCLRTAASLLAVGALERCETLPDRLEPEDLATLELDPGYRDYWMEIMLGLTAAGEAELAAAVEARLLRLGSRRLVTDGPGAARWRELEREAGLDVERARSGGGRGRDLVRRLILRMLRPHTARQRQIDLELVRGAADLERELEAERIARERLERRVRRLEAEPSLTRHP